MKKRYIVLIVFIYSIIIILLVVTGMLFADHLSGESNSELIDTLKDILCFRIQDTAESETSEVSTTSYYDYVTEHWDEYLAEIDRLEATYLDKNRQHIPHDSDFDLIEEGMHISQVVAIVGKPHDMSIPFPHGIWLCWTSDSGTQYSIEFDGETPYDLSIEFREKILSNGIATCICVSHSELDTTEAETLSREQAVALYMDREKTHKPTAQDFDQIQKGMTVQEVVEILGKPHDFHGASNFSYALVWESVGGEMLTVYIGSDGGPLDIETVMEGNYTVGEPMRESES
ncbi:MAG: hypothetical protein IJW70_09575 [Clostridia bacterium]|nr:hypothetical protein [Clostridia bacterium]